MSNETKKFILDAACGPRHMWVNKKHPNTLYIDNRIEKKGYIKRQPNGEVKPDKLMDFTKMEFPDKTFKLVVWDPPHLVTRSHTADMIKKYGGLHPETWQSDLKKGFKECWRVLEDYGVLIFKWSSHSIPYKKVLRHFNRKPLFQNILPGRTSKTYWACFMKIPKT